MKSITTMILVLCILCAGYRLAEGQTPSNSPNEWKTIILARMGLQLEVPTAISKSRIHDGEKEAYIDVHSVNPPGGVVDEARNTAEIRLHKYALAEFERDLFVLPKREMYRNADEAGRRFLIEMQSKHLSTVRIADRRHVYFRRDIEIAGEYLVEIIAELNVADQQAVNSEGDIIRILDSIQAMKQ